MFVELHILQNFAPSNLNRDDTGAPKDCEFGGYRRARISSQCLKRAVRTAFQDHGLLPPEHLSTRTRRLVDELVRRLQAQGRTEAEGRAVAEVALRGMGLGLDGEGQTQYLLFLGSAEIDAVADLCARHWDALAAAAGSAEGDGVASGRQAKRAGKEALPDEVRGAVGNLLDGSRAADLALFGRMIADLPGRNVDGACQVAHAISTHRVSTKFDFYTAVDDLQADDETGAGMMGTVEFNSACYYRYANVDLAQLTRNLAGDADLARRSLDAFLRATIDAVPIGKQNSMAAHNPPSLILAVVRRTGLWSLANAFVRPVRPDQEGDLVRNSVRALDRYWGQLTAMYGDGEIVDAPVCLLEPDGLEHLAPMRVETVAALLERVRRALTTDARAEGSPA